MADEWSTRVTLFVPGTPDTLRGWQAALRGKGLSIQRGVLKHDGGGGAAKVEWVANDGSLGKSFWFSHVSPEVIRRIDATPGALILYFPVDLRKGREEIVEVVKLLRDAGAVAVRLEQSKLGADVSRWLELFSSEDPWSWHRGAIVFLTSKKSLQSCGMHAFSLPDVYATHDGDEGEALQQLASVLNVYQLGEDPQLLSGHTFAPDRATPRRVVERWPDTQYESGHACHNPFGVWRLGPPGGKARPTSDLVSMFIPPLRFVLAAAEKKGRPLTRKQVESIRDDAPAITMNPKDAQVLERSRGFADLNPELAWEQWQLVRSHP